MVIYFSGMGVIYGKSGTFLSFKSLSSFVYKNKKLTTRGAPVSQLLPVKPGGQAHAYLLIPF